MFVQGIDCFFGFLDASGCWNYDEVRCQGPGGQEFVDDALTDAKTDSTVE